MRLLLAILAFCLAVPTATYAQSPEKQHEMQQQRKAQLQHAYDYYRQLVLAREFMANCTKYGSGMTRAAASWGATDIRQNLISANALNSEGADGVEQQIKESIARNECDTIRSSPEVKSAFKATWHKADELMAVWHYYIHFATAHAFAGGDLADYDCGTFYSYSEINDVYLLAAQSVGRLSAKDGGTKFTTTAENFARRLHNVCRTKPDSLLTSSLIGMLDAARIEAAKPD